MKMFVILAMALSVLAFVACSDSPETFEGQEVYSPDDPAVAKGPEFKQSKFKVYTLYQPQVQRRDFNGVFHITPNGARIVRSFWKRKFNELTREGWYGDFFLEFYDYMSYLATAYPANTRQKEKMLDSLEKSFHAFCAAMGVEEEFKAFQRKQAEIYGG